MLTINFLGPIKKPSMELNANTLLEVKELLNQDESLKEWLEISAIALNDELVNSLDIKLKDGDVISILPPVCGG